MAKESPEEKLARVTRNYLRIQTHSGQENADSYLKNEGYDQKRFDTALKNKSTKKDSKGFWENVYEGAGNVAELFTQGLTFGQSIYLQAGLDMMQSKLGMMKKPDGTVMDEMSYSESLANARKREQQFRDENQGTAILTDVASGVIPGVGLFKAAQKAGSVAMKASQPIKNMLQEAKVEVPLGMMTGVGEAGSRGASPEQMVKEGTYGTAFGGIGAGLSGVLSPLFDWFSPIVSKQLSKIGIGGKPTLTSAERSAAKQYNEALSDEGTTIQEQMDLVDEYERLGMGDKVRAGTVGGTEVQDLVKNLGMTPGPTKPAVRKSLMNDLEASSEDVAEIIAKGVGYNSQGEKALITSINSQAQATAKPLYKLAYNLPNINNKRLDTILEVVNDTTKGDFYDEVLKLTKRHNADIPVDGTKLPEFTPEEMPYGNVPVSVIDVFQRAIRDIAKKTKGEDARTLWELRAKILDIAGEETQNSFNLLTNQKGNIKDVLPPEMAKFSDEQLLTLMQSIPRNADGTYQSPFTTAMRKWQGSQASKDAYEIGKKAYSNKPASKIADEFSELGTEAERDMYRLAAATNAIEQIDISPAETKNFAKAFVSKGSKEKHRLLFKDQAEVEDFIKRLELQNEIHKGASAMMPRSDTFGNFLNFFSHLREWFSTSSVVNKALSATGRVAQRAVNQAGAKEANKVLAEGLTTPGAGPANRFMQKAGQQKNELVKSAMNRGMLSSGVTGGATLGLLTPDESGPI